MPRQSVKRVMERTTGKSLRLVTEPLLSSVFDQELHVLDLGRGVLLDVFVNIEGRLTTFLSVNGQLLVELRVVGYA
ncbi:hypothetical protein [Chondromyces crocatus]|uniref:Uncharacterized protein n=1 Tax=Chondromyces crocatus TaxID=52 RepID=A0A0K1EMT5_CHOCO|nr:hypothetical protein [Chondromyces crocatus]AKT41967.1 uncharacterized protein CMC5_061890 [Chondromyces crocatus]